MTQRAPRRPIRQRVFILPVGLLLRTVVAALAAILMIAVIASGAIGRVAGGSLVADRTAVAQQRAAAERDLAVGYESATDQVRKVRALKLAISAQQADTISTKALTDLATLRHSALVSLGQIFGAAADAAENDARSTEQAMDAKRGQPQPSAAPVLLAPRLYGIVARYNDLATRITDQATADLTQSPPASPASSPTPSPRASASPTPSPR